MSEPPGALAQREEIDRRLKQSLEALARRCVELDMPVQARETRDYFIQRDPRRQYVFLAPTDATDQTDPAEETDDKVRFWRDALNRVRREHADELFRWATSAESAAVCYRLIHEVLHHDPDHQQARKALGYVPRSSGWYRRQGQISSRKGRADQAAIGMRAGRYWVIDSEHFRITTDADRQAGLDLAGVLENLHVVWRQVFFDFWAGGSTTRDVVDGRLTGPRVAGRHRVVLFADRERYTRALRKWQARIDVTTGIYMDQQQVAYLYLSEPPSTSTWYHEVTHQLFQEAVRAGKGVGEHANFWVVEGVAMYMESLAPAEGYVTLGGADAERLQFARFNLLNGGVYEPFDRVVAMGRSRIQEDPGIRRLYSQFAGQAHFLMDGDGGRHRAALVNYLLGVYRQSAGASSLSDAAGTPLVELDRSYREFLDVTDADLRLSPTLDRAANLSLGKTSVTKQGVAQLERCGRLRWLNLGFTPSDDESMLALRQATRLRELNLEYTHVTDQAMKTVGTFTELQELDLSGTSVTDGGLAELTRLKNLKILWLTKCPVTDAGLEHLREMKQLESLEVSGTAISDEALDRLRRDLPGLKRE